MKEAKEEEDFERPKDVIFDIDINQLLLASKSKKKKKKKRTTTSN